MLLFAGDKDTVVDPGNSLRLSAAVRARGGQAEATLVPGKGHIGLLTALRGRSPMLDRIVDFVTSTRVVEERRAA